MTELTEKEIRESRGQCFKKYSQNHFICQFGEVIEGYDAYLDKYHEWHAFPCKDCPRFQEIKE